MVLLEEFFFCCRFFRTVSNCLSEQFNSWSEEVELQSDALSSLASLKLFKIHFMIPWTRFSSVSQFIIRNSWLTRLHSFRCLPWHWLKQKKINCCQWSWDRESGREQAHSAKALARRVLARGSRAGNQNDPLSKQLWALWEWQERHSPCQRVS